MNIINNAPLQRARLYKYFSLRLFCEERKSFCISIPVLKHLNFSAY